MLVTEDMKKMVQIPILRSRAARNTKVFGASLSELRDRGLVEDGVPVVLRRLVEHLRKHGEKSLCCKNVWVETYLFHQSGNEPLFLYKVKSIC